MNRVKLRTRISYEWRLIWRDWMFRVFCILGLGWIWITQYLTQGEEVSRWFMVAMPGAIPFVNASLFILLQSLLVVYAVVERNSEKQRSDACAAMLVRPIANSYHVLGECVGLVCLLSLCQFFSFLGAMLINLFVSESPFCVGDYLFYWLTLVFPALVFVIGLSVFLTKYINNMGFSMLILLFVLVVMWYGLMYWNHGVLDFTATDLPNVFSEMMGYTGGVNYLLHRCIYFLVGIGLCLCAVGGERRLPNRRRGVCRLRWLGVTIIMAGISLGIIYSACFERDDAVRMKYRKSALRGGVRTFVRVERHDLMVEQHGNQIRVKSRFRVENRDTLPVAQWVVYLNPGLKLSCFEDESGEMVSYVRDNQVVRVYRLLKAGEGCEFVMEYEGAIDERVCYLDVASDDYWRMQWRSSPMRFGKRYAFVEDNYILLTPESLWYPVTVPPVEVASVYATGKDFTDFSLRVIGLKQSTVLSQGEKWQDGDTVFFKNKQRLSGVTLCAGAYESRAVRVDSVDFELYFYTGHDKLSALFEHLSEEEIQKMIKKSTRRLRLDKYPFQKLMFMEVPISFAANERSWKSCSEYIQPELVMFPERWNSQRIMDVKKYFRALEEQNRQQASMNLSVNRSLEEQFLTLFVNELASSKTTCNLTNMLLPVFPKNYKKPDIVPNEQWVGPLFTDYSSYLFSMDYPIMDKILFAMGIQGRSKFLNFDGDCEVVDAVRYLSAHSLEEAMRDSSLSKGVFEAIMQLKTDYIKDYVSLYIAEEEFNVFVQEFKESHAFREVDFRVFLRELKLKKGVDLNPVLSAWFRGREIPTYLVKDLRVDEVVMGVNKRGRFSFKIKNTSGVDGIITISCGDAGNRESRYRYLIPAGKSKEIKKVVDGEKIFYKLNLNLSSNIPHGYLEISQYNRKEVQDTADGIFDLGHDEFLHGDDELIVDNEMPGFRLVEGDKRKRLKEVQESKQYQFDYFGLRDMEQQFPAQWTWCAGNSGIYGNVIRSLVYKKSGDGRAKAIWTGNLAKSGIYEVFVYVGKDQVRMDGVPVQYYTLSCRGGKEQVALKLESDILGWISLGEFDIVAGMNYIELEDRGIDSEQLIYADAVKWKWIREK